MKKTFSLVHFLIVLTCALGLAGVAAAKEPSALGRVTVAAVWGSGYASYSTDHGNTWSWLWPN